MGQSGRRGRACQRLTTVVYGFLQDDSTGVIARVRRGVYLIPPRLPLGGQWPPSEVLAISALIGGQGGRCQICGPNAFNRYGFDEQVPARVYAYNNRISP